MTITEEPTTVQEYAEVRLIRAVRERVDEITEGARRTPEANVLDSILSVAVSHDKLCQFYEDTLYRQLGLRGGSRSESAEDSELNDYLYAAIELCAILARAAMRRVPTTAAIAKAASHTDTIHSLEGAELEEFMQPIFAESGIGNRFEAQLGREVYANK